MDQEDAARIRATAARIGISPNDVLVMGAAIMEELAGFEYKFMTSDLGELDLAQLAIDAVRMLERAHSSGFVEKKESEFAVTYYNKGLSLRISIGCKCN